MNNPRILFTVFTKTKQRFIESFRTFHTLPVLNQRVQSRYGYSREFDNSLFFTNLPSRKAKTPKVKPVKLHTNVLMIDCKRKELNHYVGMTYGKFETVPLASKGWHHSKSVGDYFKILPSSFHPAFVTKKDLPETFEENGVKPEIIEQLKKINITHPTVIQAKVFKHLLQGRNLFMSGECGSGKTVGYVAALIQNVLKWKEQGLHTSNAPIGIILLPSRELAIQVGLLADTLGRDLGITCQTLIGGNIKDLTVTADTAPVDILICTLRVFVRHLRAKLYTTIFCKHVIVDEVDMFLERSFLPEFKSFLEESKLEFTGLASDNISNQSAQICFASATVPKEMEIKLFKLIKGNDMEIETTPYVHKTLSFAKQVFMRVTKSSRPEALLKIVKSNVKNKTPTMIFSNKLNTAFWVSQFLKSNGIECGLITATLYADDRLTNFRNFERGAVGVISCTDLASRGLSFTTVKHVINFEFPSFMSDYIHRTGRTGRLDQGENCVITNFISSKHELFLLRQIELAMRTNTPLPHVRENRVKTYDQTAKMRSKALKQTQN